MTVCLVSILKNSEASSFNVVVVGKFENKNILDKVNKSLAIFNNYELQIKEFDFKLMNSYPIRCHYSLDIYTRLWVQRFFSEEVEKVVYLDSDMIVTGDITELWNIDIGNNVLGAVPIPWYKQTHLPNFELKYGFFNSGLLVFNLKEWSRQNCEKKVLQFIIDNADILHNPDQDALNDCFYKQYMPLPYEWNLIRPYYQPSVDPSVLKSLKIEDIKAILTREKIIHYNGSSKPWHYMDNHIRKNIYYEYLKYTQWRHFIPEDRTINNIVKKTLSKILPKKIKIFIKNLFNV